MNFLGYLVLRFWIFLLFAIVTSPVPLALTLLAAYFARHDSLESYRWILAFPFLLWLYGVGWMVDRTASKMILQGTSLVSSTKASLNEAKLFLAFLPLIGGWFVSRKEGDDDDEKNSR